MVRLTGWYQLPGSMPQTVDFAELFPASFMRKYTRYRSWDKFLSGSGFAIASQADFEALPEADMDAYVRRATKFGSWKEMLDTATDKYAARQLARKEEKPQA